MNILTKYPSYSSLYALPPQKPIRFGFTDIGNYAQIPVTKNKRRAGVVEGVATVFAYLGLVGDKVELNTLQRKVYQSKGEYSLELDSPPGTKKKKRKYILW